MNRYEVPTPREHIPKADIVKLWEKQGGKCAKCGKKLHPMNFHVDHKKPLALGGTNSIRNLQLLCPNCHNMKTKEDRRKIAKAKNMREDDVIIPEIKVPKIDLSYIEELLGLGTSEGKSKKRKRSKSILDLDLDDLL